MLDDGVEQPLRADVDAHVDHFEAGAFEHDDAEVFADVVDIALDGQHEDLADGFDAGVAENWLEDGHGALHRLGGDHHFGHEVFADLEETTNFLERGNQGLEEDLQGIHPQVDALLGEFFGDGRAS